ncbi:MAG: LamG domain-containing protein [Methylococcus sp.]
MKPLTKATLIALMLASSSILADLNTGLVAYYLFNGNANDESGNGFNGAVNGATLTEDRFGSLDSAYDFNGADNFILIRDPLPLKLKIQNKITLSAWIKITGMPPNKDTLGMVVGSQCDACGRVGASIFVDGRVNPDSQTGIPSRHIHFQIGDGSWHATNSKTQLPLNRWVHIVATRTANANGKIYYNGVSQAVASAAWAGKISYDGTELSIGRQKDLNRYFFGQIDNVRIYNRALSPAEVLSLYKTEYPPIIKGTAAWPKLPYQVTCENVTTNTQVVITAKGSAYDCEKSGLVVNSGDRVKVTVDGLKY